MENNEIKNWISQIRKGFLDLYILALIAQKDQYAFEIVQDLKFIEGLIVTEGTIYPVLNRLKSSGYVSSYWKESTMGPPRKYYSITEEGLRFLEQMKKEWYKLSGALNNILEKESKNEQ